MALISEIPEALLTKALVQKRGRAGDSAEIAEARASQSTSTPDYDVILAADFTRGGDFAFRLAQEIRQQAANRRHVGLVQTRDPGPGSTIAAEVQSCVRRGLAEVLEPEDLCNAATLVVHSPALSEWDFADLKRISATTVVFVCHQRRDYSVRRIDEKLGFFKRLVWAPASPGARRLASGQLDLHSTDWFPPVLPVGPTSRRDGRAPKAVGWIFGNGFEQPALSGSGILDLTALTLDDAGLDHPDIVDCISIEAGYMSLDRLVAGLDAFCCFPCRDDTIIPETLLWTAIDAGCVVVLPSRFRRQYGHGAVYCKPENATSRLCKLFGDSRKLVRHRKLAKEAARNRFGGPVCHPAIEGQLRPRRGPKLKRARPRPALLLPSNGVGLGHVSRLLAIARRLDPVHPVVFATQAQAAGVIEALGFAAEYIPSATYVGGPFDVWDDWFRFEVARVVDAYDPAIVVYDGNNPSDGLLRAVAGRRDCRLAWVRRGLWGNTTSPFMKNARWCDIVIEPGELDGQPDAGTTAERRHEAHGLPPICLLDREDVLPRSEAASLLGLDPNKPAVLVQLGAGFNRDIVSLMDRLVAEFRRYPDLQIAIAEWVNAAHCVNYWPDVTYLRGFPLSQYFGAFDFSVSAAGYNTFHEVINLGLPTIFVPNRHPSMDDQAGRAEYAQSLGAAFELDESDLTDLPDLVALMMQPKAREYLIERCTRLARPNGADEAATVLASLMELAR